MTLPVIRLTRPTVEVLRLLLTASADAPLWGAKIGEQADLGKSSVSQILARLTALGWITARQEVGPHPGRPARIFRALTQRGRHQAEAALAARQVHNGRPPAPVGVQGSGAGQAPRPGLKDDPTAQKPADKPVRRRMAAHWPIRFPDLGRLRRSAATAADDRFQEDGVAYEYLRCLEETLAAINRTVTREVFTQAAADPIHSLEYEPVLTAIGVEADEIRKKALYAPRARNG